MQCPTGTSARPSNERSGFFANGAGAVITERIEGNEYAAELENGDRKRIFESQDIRKVMAEMSRSCYGDPASVL